MLSSDASYSTAAISTAARSAPAPPIVRLHVSVAPGISFDVRCSHFTTSSLFRHGTRTGITSDTIRRSLT